MGVFRLFNPFENGEIFQSIISILQWVLKLIVTPKVVIILFVSVLFISLVLGLTLSGCFNILNHFMAKKSKVRGGNFADGVRKYFLRIWGMTFVSLCVCLLFALFILIATVPALIVTKAAMSGKSGMFLTAVLVDLITAGVVFFGVIFFRIYIVFWFPSAMMNDKRAFSTGKRIADIYFWALVRRFLALDILFVLCQFFLINMADSILSFAAKWVFYSIFLAFSITYTFALFHGYYEKQRQLSLQQNNEDDE